jgi:hypothetical protein
LSTKPWTTGTAARTRTGPACGADPHRPGLRRVMELAESGAVDVVLAKKRNRLFRSSLY